MHHRPDFPRPISLLAGAVLLVEWPFLLHMGVFPNWVMLALAALGAANVARGLRSVRS